MAGYRSICGASWRNMGFTACSADHGPSGVSTGCEPLPPWGKLQGRRESGYRGKNLSLPPDRSTLAYCSAGAFDRYLWTDCLVCQRQCTLGWRASRVICGRRGDVALLAKSLLDFSQTGPRMREEVLTHYRHYTLFALGPAICLGICYHAIYWRCRRFAVLHVECKLGRRTGQLVLQHSRQYWAFWVRFCCNLSASCASIRGCWSPPCTTA